ncbi:helix-turn-helix domain-containing protein [Croceicoccus pelagius]|uniref:helix-turn-helix domain-containing protein n=1 Tax=Croceicoccus pelagius TaxID=1703341 RepID=UPI0009EED546
MVPARPTVAGRSGAADPAHVFHYLTGSRAALDRLDGNISQAARAIGMTRAQVQYSKKKNG